MEAENGENRKDNLNTYESIKTVQVPDEILCKYCANKLPSFVSEYNGETMHRHTNGHCLVYTDELKPHDVLWGESYECEFYEEG